jgi:sigma-B regulation protein RsbU (phosphoserine phosphatase)
LVIAMPDVPAPESVRLEVVSPDRTRRVVQVSETPFFMGRGRDAGNHLDLPDPRISRQCAAIIHGAGGYYIEDRGHRRGIFVNGRKIERGILRGGDVITFGFEDSYRIIFKSSAGETTVQSLLTRIGGVPGDDSSSSGLRKLNVLLQATSLLHSQLPLESVLATMLDHAVAITNADRGLLLEADPSGSLRVRLARGKDGAQLSPESLAPSQTALRQALEQRSSVITEDLNRAEAALQTAQSIVAQSLRAVISIPLYANSPDAGPAELTTRNERRQFLGIVYLDSRRPTAFSKLDREILDALAVEAASILDNARLVERERERHRLEQELSIARDIQQALLPRQFRELPHLTVTGMNAPCLAVGGDYFDVFPLSDERTAFLIADICGKGLGAALVSTMLQGALSGMRMGTDPASVVNHINRFLCEHTEVGRYATMFFGILDRDGHLEYINAGHPSPLLLRGGEVAEPFSEGSFPVGLIPEANYVATRLQLLPEDTLVLFSDGVTEAMGPGESLFGVSRLRDTLAGQHQAPLEHLQKRVLQSVEDFACGASQADDITLLLLRYRAAAQIATA